MERVNKGEIYWCINTRDMLHLINYRADEYSEFDDEMFNSNNYFNTREGVEVIARKIYAIFNGADVIEMPSINDVMNRLPHAAGYEQNMQLTGYRHGYCNCYDWLKSKIVK